MKNNKKLIGTGVVAALAASLCCITPVLALFAGVSGLASAFTWLEPLRPFLIATSVIVLGYAWYQKLKPQKQEIDCACETTEKSSFWQSTQFLTLITIFSAISLTFPSYAHLFYGEVKPKITQHINPAELSELYLDVEGMTCESCNLHVEHEIAKLPGYIDAEADYKTGKVHVTFDPKKTSKTDVVKAVLKTGYNVLHYEN